MAFRLLTLFLLAISLNASALLFEDTFEDVGRWDVLDIHGGGQVTPATDHNCPPGYGPGVLRVQGTGILGLAKGVKLTHGTIVALYRENDAVRKDADGIIAFGAQFGDDIRIAYNTKTQRPHVWFEQDNDTGIQFRAVNELVEEVTVAEKAGFGRVTDSWNVTNWIWQKVEVDGKVFRAKYWPA